MAAPTRVQSIASLFNDVNSKTTASFSVQTGDIITVRAVAESDTSTFTISGGSLTWNLLQEVTTVSNCDTAAWYATATSNTSITVTVDDTGSTVNHFGFVATTWRGATGVASAKTNSTGAPSLTFSTAAANSAVEVVVGDWSAVDGTTRTWRSVNGSAATEETYYRDATRYVAYLGYHPDAGAAGSITVGLSAPSGQTYGIIGIEVQGTASSAKAPPPVRSAAARYAPLFHF